MNTQCCCCSYCSLIPRLFRIRIQECSVWFMSDFRDSCCLHFLFTAALRISTKMRQSRMLRSRNGKVFLVHFVGVLVCKAISFAFHFKCQIVSLGTCPEIPLSDFIWFFLLFPSESRTLKQSISLVSRIFETFVSDTAKRLSARCDKIIFQLRWKTKPKVDLKPKTFVKYFILENNRTTKTR